MIAYLFAFVYIILDTKNNIKNLALRTILYYIDIAFISSIVGYLIYLIRVKYQFSSFSDAFEKIKSVMATGNAMDKDHRGSAEILFLLNMAILALTIGGAGYVVFLIAEYARTHNKK
jgi:hypothetical protein